MKQTSVGLRAHLDERVTSLATCWEIIRRDGQTFRYTDHDQNITISGDVYSALSGFARTAIETEASLAVPNMDIAGFLSTGQITRQEVEAGKWDRAEVRVFVVNWADLTQGIMRVRRGWFGELTATPRGLFKTELRGLSQTLSQRILELFGPECRADLGDSRCTVPISPTLRANDEEYEAGDYIRVATAAVPANDYSDFENRIYVCVVAGTSDSTPPTYDTGVGNVTVDGTAEFEAVEAWTRHAEVASVVDDRLTFTITVSEARAVDDWFNYGGLIFDSGDNEGAVMEVKDWTNSTATIQLFSPTPFNVQVGDKLHLYAGCDKSRDMCKIKFANLLNMRAEPFMTGNDYVFGSRGDQ